MRLVSLEEFLINNNGQKNGLDKLTYLVELSNQSKLKAIKNSITPSGELSLKKFARQPQRLIRPRSPTPFARQSVSRRPRRLIRPRSPTPFARQSVSRRPRRLITPHKTPRITPRRISKVPSRLSSKSTPIFLNQTKGPLSRNYYPRIENWNGGLSVPTVPIMGY